VVEQRGDDYILESSSAAVVCETNEVRAESDDVGMANRAVGRESCKVVGVQDLTGLAFGGLRAIVIDFHSFRFWAERHYGHVKVVRGESGESMCSGLSSMKKAS